jgi:hypothetical protein
MAASAVMGSVAGLVKGKGLDTAGLTSFLDGLDGEVKPLERNSPI